MGRQCFWPLTLDDNGRPEFWQPSNMRACRACILEAKRKAAKIERNSNPELREKRRQYAAQYYSENKRVHNMKHAIYMKAYRAAKKENVA